MSERLFWRRRFLNQYENEKGIILKNGVVQHFLGASEMNFFGLTPETILKDLIRSHEKPDEDIGNEN